MSPADVEDKGHPRSDMPPRPVALSVCPEGIPDQLKALDRWVVWRYDPPDEKHADWAKVLHKARAAIHGRAEKARSTDAADWCDFGTALRAYRGGGWDGVGFVFTFADGLAGVDLDDCLSDSGALEAWGTELLALLDTYTEVSPGGSGLKAFLIGGKPAGARCKKRYGGGAVEVYDHARYFTVTGRRWEGAPSVLNERTDALAELCRKVFSEPRPQGPPPHANGAKRGNPFTPAGGRDDDEAVLAMAMAARDGTKFRRLWEGDVDAYDGDDSAADLALCNLLRFWTRGDRAQMDRLFRRSGLMRKKWDEQRGAKTYGERTLDVAMPGEVYEPRRRAPRQSDESGGPGPSPPGQQPATRGGGEWPPPAVVVLRDWLRSTYGPTFRRGRNLYSWTLGREVSVSEVSAVPTSDVLKLLAEQADAPRLPKSAALDPQKLPAHFKTWLPVAWGDLAAGLPEEAESAEVVEPAQEEFARALSAALLTMVPLTYRHEGGGRAGLEAAEVQRRPVIEWARMFATTPRWASVRGYRIWSKREASERPVGGLRVAIRAELLSQLNARDLGGITQRRLSDLCVLYALGAPCHVSGGAARAVELSADFLADLLAGPADDTQTQNDEAPAYAGEGAS